MIQDVKYLLYRIKYKLNFLTHLDIEINNNCNHACTFCWHSKSETRNFTLSQMPFVDVASLLREGRTYGMKSVKLNLRGEPTLHRHLSEIAQYAKRVGYVDIMINTNGELLADKWLSIRRFITTVIISVGSTNKTKYSQLHDVSHGQAVKVDDSMRFVHRHKGQAKVKLNCHKSKDGDIDYKYLKKQFPKFKIVKRHLMKRKGEDLSIERKKTRKKLCPHMMRRLTVQANGDIYPCCMSYDSPTDIKLGTSIPEAMVNRKKLIAEYKKGVYRQSCLDCTSQDVFNYE